MKTIRNIEFEKGLSSDRKVWTVFIDGKSVMDISKDGIETFGAMKISKRDMGTILRFIASL